MYSRGCWFSGWRILSRDNRYRESAGVGSRFYSKCGGAAPVPDLAIGAGHKDNLITFFERAREGKGHRVARVCWDLDFKGVASGNHSIELGSINASDFLLERGGGVTDDLTLQTKVSKKIGKTIHGRSYDSVPAM